MRYSQTLRYFPWGDIHMNPLYYIEVAVQAKCYFHNLVAIVYLQMQRHFIMAWIATVWFNKVKGHKQLPTIAPIHLMIFRQRKNTQINLGWIPLYLSQEKKLQMDVDINTIYR